MAAAQLQLVPNEDPELQQDGAQTDSRATHRRGIVVRVGVATGGLALLLVGSVQLAGGGLFGGGQAEVDEVRDSMGLALVTKAEHHYAAAVETTHHNSSKCHWLKMKQHDYPDRGDVKTVKYTDFKDVADVERYAEENNFPGFAMYQDVAYLKGGANAPRSWRDLLWMGQDYRVDFFLCEKRAVWRQTQERVDKAVAVLNGYVSEKTESVKGQWVSVHAVPKNEGTGMSFDNQDEAKTVKDMQILCGAHPDCVGFVYNSFDNTFFAKKKGTGFAADTATYYQKDNPQWVFANAGMSCDAGCEKAGKVCTTALTGEHNSAVDTSEGLDKVLAELGEKPCRKHSQHDGHDRDVPNKNPQNGMCYVSSPNRTHYDCGAPPNPSDKRRLCMCGGSDFQWHYIQSRAVGLDATEAHSSAVAHITEAPPPHDYTQPVWVKKM